MFFELLNESTHNVENVNKKFCYITNEELNDTSISLPCNHSFNYYPLYEEIVKQKCSIRNKLNHLSLGAIECPYCRICVPLSPKSKKKMLYLENITHLNQNLLMSGEK